MAAWIAIETQQAQINRLVEALEKIASDPEYHSALSYEVVAQQALSDIKGDKNE